MQWSVRISIAALAIALSAEAVSAGGLDLRLATSGGLSAPNHHGQATVESLELGLDRPFPRFEGGLVLGFHGIDEPAHYVASRGTVMNQAHGISAAVVVRRDFGQVHGLQPYAELASGPIWTDRRVPVETSRINFLTHAGAGVTFVNAPVPLSLGLRFSHISNGGLASPNPGWNIVTLTAQWLFRMRQSAAGGLP